jgi:alkyl hydroperoxide reductase subunit F
MQNLYDLIIIGGGPAGIAAGIYASRKKLKTLLITKDFLGQASKASEVENYPGFEEISGSDLMEKFKNHLKKFEIEIREGEWVKEIQKTKEGFKVKANHKEEYETKAIIITSGRDPRPLEVPGEKEFIGKGVSYCPICDAPFFKNKTVAVIGGGNAAFVTALDLKKYCSKIYILEFSSKIRADEINQERVEASGGIEVILNAQVKEIKGKEWVESLVYEDLSNKETKELPLEGVFVEIGSIPATSFVKDLVEFTETDEIKINSKTCETKTPGLFAAGDVTDVKYKQIIIAAGEGTKAALTAYEYLQNMEHEA